MFTKEELEMLLSAIDASPPNSYQPQGINAVRDKLIAVIKDIGAGPCRGKLATVGDDDMDWVNDDDLDNLVDHHIITKSSKLTAMVNLGDSLTKHNDALLARIAVLKPLEQLTDENERLKLELVAVGPPEALEEIEILKRQLASVAGERSVLQAQVAQLKTAIRAERVGRMALDGQTLAPELDPCLPKLTRPCPHEFDYTRCDICRPLLPPATPEGQT
jgi:hypothetical protein